MSTYVLTDIFDGSQSHQSINRKEARCKILLILNKDELNGRECRWPFFLVPDINKLLLCMTYAFSAVKTTTHPWSHRTPSPTIVCLANVGSTWPSNMSVGTFLRSWLKLCLTSNVLSIIALDAVKDFSGLCVGIVVCESFGCIAIILHPESSILGIGSLICSAAVFT